MVAGREIKHYLPYREYLDEALVAERLGLYDEAAAAYRRGFQDDVLRAVQVLRILSVHPEREALVQEAYAHVRAVVDRAKAGEDAVIYVTSKGADRYLEVLTQEEVLAAGPPGRPTRHT